MSPLLIRALFLLRLAFGWMFFYAGFSKIINPSWSAAGYLQNATTFHDLYARLAQPDLAPIINFINEWSLLLLGLSLISGVWVKYSTRLGSLLMLLYYFPVLSFPYVGKSAFLIDDHIIYIFLLLSFSFMEIKPIWKEIREWKK